MTAVPAEPVSAEAPGVPEPGEPVAADPVTADAVSVEAPDLPEGAAPAVAEPAAPAIAPMPPVREPERVPLATAIARLLAAAGTRVAFTVPGESFLPLLQALPEAGIRVIATRHEGAAAFAAEAATQLSGKPQLLLVTRTVGLANAAIGLHTATSDSAPMVTIAGDVRIGSRGREGFQESDLARGIGSLARHASAPQTAQAAIAALVDGLAAIGRGRPGPLLLAIPEDRFAQPVELPHPVTRAATPAPDRSAVRRVLHLLAASERGVILAGGGVLRARSSRRLLELAEALAIPVVASWRRGDVVPNDHPLYLGMSGYWAPPTVRARLIDADAMLVIGSRLSEPASFGWRIPSHASRWAHVDLAPRHAHAGLHAPTISIAADAGRFLDAAMDELRAGAVDKAGWDRRAARAAEDRAAWDAAARVDHGTWDGRGVHPGRVIAALARQLPASGIVTTDAGNFAGWIARGYRFPRPGTFLGPTSGAMGYALPAAIAASLLHPDRPVVAVAGDGGFAMTMAELETAVRVGARPVVLVFDNGGYGTIAMHQAKAGFDRVASELGPVDAAAIARACGALGFTVTDDAAVEPAIAEALAARRPAVIHLAVDPRWVSVDDRP